MIMRMKRNLVDNAPNHRSLILTHPVEEEECLQLFERNSPVCFLLLLVLVFLSVFVLSLVVLDCLQLFVSLLAIACICPCSYVSACNRLCLCLWEIHLPSAIASFTVQPAMMANTWTKRPTSSRDSVGEMKLLPTDMKRVREPAARQKGSKCSLQSSPGEFTWTSRWGWGWGWGW